MFDVAKSIYTVIRKLTPFGKGNTNSVIGSPKWAPRDQPQGGLQSFDCTEMSERIA